MRDVKVILFEPERDVRSALRGKLRDVGYENIRDMQNAAAVEKAMLAGDVDLAIVETRHVDDDICTIMRDVRHGLRGDNPFPVTIATCGSADETHLRSVADAGFDSALIKPFDGGSIAKWLRYFRENRKPFIVTHDYIGPDRRKDPRAVGRDSRVISVPNPIRIIADGMGRDYLRRQIRDARSELDEEKMIKDGASIKWLVDRLCGAAMSNNAKAIRECGLLAKQIHRQAEAMTNRSSRTTYAHVADLCHTVAEVATGMAAQDTVPGYKDLELLRNLNLAIARALHAESGEEVYAQEIQRSVLPKK